jgi:hypothetical protein
MNPEPTPEELRELLGAYALDALDPKERAQVDALLLADPSARAELHELEHAAAWLGHASLRPPTSAWDAIAAQVDRDLASDAAEPAPPMPTSTAHSTSPHRATRWLVAAAVVLVLTIGAAGVVAVVDRSSGSESITTQYQAAMHNPLARVTTLRSADGKYSARVVVLRDRTGYMAEAVMPAAGAGRDFQLWSITPKGPVSVGLLRGGGDIVRFHVAGATTALAVTDEPGGGSRVPTGIPIVSGELRSV